MFSLSRKALELTTAVKIVLRNNMTTTVKIALREEMTNDITTTRSKNPMASSVKEVYVAYFDDYCAAAL